MPQHQKSRDSRRYQEELNNAGAVWVVDYCRLTVKEVRGFVVPFTEASASMKVYKNTLVHIALSRMPSCLRSTTCSNGPSAFVFAGEDVAAAARPSELR